MANGELHALGTLYINNVKQARPLRPYALTPSGAPSAGDIPPYVGGSIELRDTDISDTYRVQWREVNVGEKKLLICDRVILKKVSWNILNSYGLIFGKNVTIDGKSYKLRVLTGGSDFREGTSQYGGGKPLDNEWDQIIVNEGGFNGLPAPKATDLDSTQSEIDRLGTHNQFWNWYISGSLVQETFSKNAVHRVVRGEMSARNITSIDATTGNDYYGWRPVLEELNGTPTLTLNTSDNRTLYENDTFLIDGQATDADNGNIVNVKYSINGGTARAIATAISNGSTPISYSKSLTFKGGKLYDGETLISEALGEGTAHTLKVWAEDDKGGKSVEQVRSFYVVPNRPATLTIDPVEQKSGLINNDSITITGSVNDPESQNVIVKYKIGGGEFIEIYNGPSGAFSFDLKLADLAVGANQITLQAIDSYNFITSKALTVTKTANNTALLDSTVRYSVVPPKGTAQGIIVWVQREVGDLTVSANVSMRMNGEQESFQAMTLSNTAPVADGIVEDEFTFDAGSAKEQIVIELNLHRADPTSTAAVKLISGVLN